MLGHLEAALIGDLEPAHVLDGVAPELHADRVFLGRREHVEDAAAYGELAAALDHVDPAVRNVREASYDVVEIGLVAGLQPDGLQVTEVGHLWLQHAAHRSNDDANTAGRGVAVVGVTQPAQDGEAASDRVGAR